MSQQPLPNKTTPTRPLEMCILVSPPGWPFWVRRYLARRRLRETPGLPAPRRLGVNPTRMDLRGSKLFDDDAVAAFSRRQFVRAPFRRRERFGDRFDALVERPAGRTLLLDRQSLGMLGCALSHVEAWRVCAQLPDDALCLIIEDDAFLCERFDAGRIPWPDDADLVHLFPDGIIHYDKYAGALVRLKPPPASPANKRPMNSGAVGYVVSGASARRLLAAMLPLQASDTHIRNIDIAMLNTRRVNAYGLRGEVWIWHPDGYSTVTIGHTGFGAVKRAAWFALLFACCHLPERARRFLAARFNMWPLAPDE